MFVFLVGGLNTGPQSLLAYLFSIGLENEGFPSIITYESEGDSVASQRVAFNMAYLFGKAE